MTSPRFRTQITVEGRLIELRPNFSCYCAIEEKAKDSLMKIVYRFSKGEMLIKDVVAVVWGGMIGTAEENSSVVPLTFKELGDALVRDRWAKSASEIVSFASRCVLGYGEAVPEAAETEDKKKLDTTPQQPPTSTS